MAVLLERHANNPLSNKVTSMLLDFDDDRRSLMDMVSLISGCVWNSTGVVDLFFLLLVLQGAFQSAIKHYSAFTKTRHHSLDTLDK